MDTNAKAGKPILSLTYEQLDRWIDSLRPALLEEGFAAVVGILRGGAPLALMASQAIGAPVAFLRHDRKSRHAAWESSLPLPAPGSKVLLCEDVAGRGFTLSDCIAFLEQRGVIVKTLAGAVDELSRVRPDYANDARGYFALFPWARQAPVEDFREDWPEALSSTLGAMAQDAARDAYAIDLDGLLPISGELPASALSPLEALPGIDPSHVRLAVSGHADRDADLTLAWLRRHGFVAAELALRNPALHGETPEGLAAHKAAAAQAAGVTHFIEVDCAQAILIAQRAPLLRVVWWNAASRSGSVVGAWSWG